MIRSFAVKPSSRVCAEDGVLQSTASDLAENAIVQRVLLGDADAFEGLVERWQGR